MLLDTSVFIDFLREHGPVMDAFEKALRGQSASVVAKLELIAGLKYKKDIKSIENLFKDLQIEQISVTEEISDVAEKILKNYYHSHGIGILDCFVAATALVYDEELVTSNMKHFDFIPKLKIIKPY